MVSSQGYNSPGGAKNITGYGDVNWTPWEGQDLVAAIDECYNENAAYAQLNGNSTELLHCHDFGFNIPSEATIRGVEVSYDVQRGSAVVTQEVNYARLIDDDETLIGNNKYDTTPQSITRNDPPNTYNTHVLGASDDLWGASLTPSIVNDSSFGVVFRIEQITSSTNGNTFIGCVSVKVFYEIEEEEPEPEDPVEGRAVDRIEGDFSLLYEAPNTDVVGNRFRYDFELNTGIIDYKLKIIDFGDGEFKPNVWLGFWKFEDYQNHINLKMFYKEPVEENGEEGGTFIRLTKWEEGSSTIIEEVKWQDEPPVKYKTYHIRIIDDSEKVIVEINGSEAFTSMYTIDQTIKGWTAIGANTECRIVVDDLGFYPLSPNRTHNITIDFLEEIYGDYFNIGNIPEDLTISYNGVISPLKLLRLIEDQNDVLVEFNYTYDPVEHEIKRTLSITSEGDFKVHNDRIEIGYNTENILLTENEDDVRLAAAPVGFEEYEEADNILDDQRRLQRWLNLDIEVGDEIALWATVDDTFFEDYGPCASAPFRKESGSIFVVAGDGESPANYVNVNKMAGGGDPLPKTYYSDIGEDHPINIYWYLVRMIRSKVNPEICFDTQMLDIKFIKDYKRSYYNVNDIIYLKIPGRDEAIQSRIISTVKNPREVENDTVEIGNFKYDLFNYRKKNIKPII